MVQFLPQRSIRPSRCRTLALWNGPETMIAWTTKGTLKAEQEAQAEKIIGKPCEVEIALAQGASTAETYRRIAVSEQT